MSEKQLEAPERIWIGWPKNPADDNWYHLQPDVQNATAYVLQQPTGERCGEYAPSSARETRRLIDAIEQSIRSLSSPLGPMETATRIRLAAEYGLSYVAALRERLERDGVATTGAGAGTERTAISVSALMGYEAALREVNECEKCDLCEDHLPATIAEGELQRCGAFKPSVLGVPEPQDQCTLPDGHEGKHTLAAPTPVQPVAAAQGDVEDLHLAICQAVALMNQGDLHGGHDLLRQTLVDFADKKAPLSRSEIVRQQQRTGGSEVTAVMISPSTSTPGEGAREDAQHGIRDSYQETGDLQP